MLRLFNTFGRKLRPFQPVRKELVTIFTCGPSVYQRAHIGNFRTFLFEDILVRYLEYSGHKVRRGLIFTDIEDKAVLEAKKKHTSVQQLADNNISEFLKETRLLRMKSPDYMPKASESVMEAVQIIEELLERKMAYWHKGNVYFDALKFPHFGKLYGLDMSKWPRKKIRFHKDTYPGIQWNLGDFILWHGHKKCDTVCWNTSLGNGRPSWNIQDPAMVMKHFDETLSVYCGGIDNLYRHHDYTLAILESIRPYPMARFWLHCHHLYVNMKAAADLLKAFKTILRRIEKRALSAPARKSILSERIIEVFSGHMDNDLSVKEAFDGVHAILVDLDIPGSRPSEAAGIVKALKQIDEVLQVIF
jgi:cysteinyl-tRNA synthetase